MNHTDPRILDLWIADFIYENSELDRAETPEAAMGRLIEKHASQLDLQVNNG